MAVVVDPKDVDEFMGYAAEENLEATKVAVVTEEPRLVLSWRGKKIVDLSRAFLDTNGAHQETKVAVDIPSRKDSILVREEVTDVKEKWMETLKDLNVCSYSTYPLVPLQATHFPSSEIIQTFTPVVRLVLQCSVNHPYRK